MYDPIAPLSVTKNLSLAPGHPANLPKNLSLGPEPVRSYHPLQTVLSIRLPSYQPHSKCSKILLLEEGDTPWIFTFTEFRLK